jgi:hypothetical protein
MRKRSFPRDSGRWARRRRSCATCCGSAPAGPRATCRRVTASAHARACAMRACRMPYWSCFACTCAYHREIIWACRVHGGGRQPLAVQPILGPGCVGVGGQERTRIATGELQKAGISMQKMSVPWTLESAQRRERPGRVRARAQHQSLQTCRRSSPRAGVFQRPQPSVPLEAAPPPQVVRTDTGGCFPFWGAPLFEANL